MIVHFHPGNPAPETPPVQASANFSDISPMAPMIKLWFYLTVMQRTTSAGDSKADTQQGLLSVYISMERSELRIRRSMLNVRCSNAIDGGCQTSHNVSPASRPGAIDSGTALVNHTRGLGTTWQTPAGVSTAWVKYLFLNQIAALTRRIKTGTSTRGPMTAANA